MHDPARTFAVWQSTMCPSYLLQLRKIVRFLTENGWREVEQDADAEVVIIGACAGFLSSFSMYQEKIGALQDLPARIVVYGCLPKVHPQFYGEQTPDGVLAIPSRHPERIEALVENPAVRFSDLPDETEFRAQDTKDPDPVRRYIVVQEGCTEHCAYCPHKIGIGSASSRSLERVCNAVREAVAQGARQLYVDGNDCGAWGVDLTPPATFMDLVSALLDASGTATLQFGNIAPKWFRIYGSALAGCLAHPRITNVKVPVQTTSERLLRLMRRDPFVLGLSPLLLQMRGGNGQLQIRTDMIVGLPTETREELEETLTFIAGHFDRVAVHRFDLHPMTRVARMGLDLLPAEELDARMGRVMEFFAQHPQVDARFDAWDPCCMQGAGE